MKPGFDDSLWSKGRSGFGTPETPGTHVNTRWDTDDIYIAPRDSCCPPARLPHNLRLYLHHDEDAEIYFNGVRLARPRGFVAEYVTIPISAAGREALHAGKNLVAVHCHQTTGGQYIDVGIVGCNLFRRRSESTDGSPACICGVTSTFRQCRKKV